MAFDIKKVDYYDVVVEGRVRDASRLLSVLAGAGVDLLAYKAVAIGPMRTRLTLVPSDGTRMVEGVATARVDLDGPREALYVRGGEEPGALAEIYERLARAEIDVHESTGLAHIQGGYGVLLYLEQDDCERAVAAMAV